MTARTTAPPPMLLRISNRGWEPGPKITLRKLPLCHWMMTFSDSISTFQWLNVVALLIYFPHTHTLTGLLIFHKPQTCKLVYSIPSYCYLLNIYILPLVHSKVHSKVQFSVVPHFINGQSCQNKQVEPGTCMFVHQTFSTQHFPVEGAWWWWNFVKNIPMHELSWASQQLMSPVDFYTITVQSAENSWALTATWRATLQVFIWVSIPKNLSNQGKIEDSHRNFSYNWWDLRKVSYAIK